MRMVSAWLILNEKYRCLRAPVLNGCGNQEKGGKPTPASTRAISEPLSPAQLRVGREGYRIWTLLDAEEKAECVARRRQEMGLAEPEADETEGEEATSEQV